MKRTHYQSVGDVCRQALEDFNMTTRLREQQACRFWQEMMGPAVAARASRPTVVRGVMMIGIPDAALRHELSMHRSAMVDMLNRRVGEHVIDDIRFTS